MASACNVHGIIGVQNGHSFQYGSGKNFWKHEGFIPLTSGDLPVEFFTFGGDGAPLDNGAYCGVARVVARTTAGVTADAEDPILQLFANDDFLPIPPLAIADADCCMPPPVFVIAGKVCRTNLEYDHHRAFDVDVSQYGAVPQQLIRLRCYYSNRLTRFTKTPLPSVSKHVIVHGYLTGFSVGRCLITVRDISFGPSDGFSVASPDVSTSTKLASYDWSGGRVKRMKREDSGPSA